MGDVSSIPGLGRSPGEGNGNPLQYSCLGNPMDRGSWLATVYGVTKELNTFFETSLQLGESTEPVCCCFICSSVALEQSRADLQRLVG